jgi:hypothetical protein
MERPHVRDVANEAVEKRGPARRVQRLEHDRRARLQFVRRQLEKAEQVARLQVLDDLRREQAADRRVGLAFEIPDEIPFGDVEPPRAADFDHLVIEIQPAPGDPFRLQQVEELAAPAADVEHVLRALEVRQVSREPLADGVLRAAELILEPDVLV